MWLRGGFGTFLDSHKMLSIQPTGRETGLDRVRLSSNRTVASRRGCPECARAVLSVPRRAATGRRRRRSGWVAARTRPASDTRASPPVRSMLTTARRRKLSLVAGRHESFMTFKVGEMTLESVLCYRSSRQAVRLSSTE